MTLADLMLIFVVFAITGVTIALVGIQKAINGLAAEMRKRETAENNKGDAQN